MEVNNSLRFLSRGLLAAATAAACIALIPLAAQLGLLILGTAPNLRHPPSDLMGEAVGWSLDDLGSTVRDEIHSIEGISRTTSCAIAKPKVE